MSILNGTKKQKPLHPTVYQDKISQYEMDLVIALLVKSESMTKKLPILESDMCELIERIKEDEHLIKNIKDILIIKLDTLLALIQITLKFIKEPEEVKTSSEVNTQETTDKDNYIQ
jgi:hypothetical protein